MRTKIYKNYVIQIVDSHNIASIYVFSLACSLAPPPCRRLQLLHDCAAAASNIISFFFFFTIASFLCLSRCFTMVHSRIFSKRFNQSPLPWWCMVFTICFTIIIIVIMVYKYIFRYVSVSMHSHWNEASTCGKIVCTSWKAWARAGHK